MLIIRLLHILTSIWFMSGLLGRWLAYAQAQRATDIHAADALLRLSDRFDRWMVVPGSQAVLAFGLFTAWLQGQPLLGTFGGTHSNWLLISLLLFALPIPIVMGLLIPRRKIRMAALDTARTLGTITPELRAALADKVVTRSRMVELLIVVVILILMILKPF
jgi:Predicted integral membrane protein (DUF2269)